MGTERPRRSTGNGLVMSSWHLSGSLLLGDGRLARLKEKIMTRRSLETTIRALKEARDMYQSQLDKSFVKELDAIILELEDVKFQSTSERKADLRLRALQAVATIARLVLDFKDMF